MLKRKIPSAQSKGGAPEEFLSAESAGHSVSTPNVSLTLRTYENVGTDWQNGLLGAFWNFPFGHVAHIYKSGFSWYLFAGHARHPSVLFPPMNFPGGQCAQKPWLFPAQWFLDPAGH